MGRPIGAGGLDAPRPVAVRLLAGQQDRLDVHHGGHSEDGRGGRTPETALDVTLPVWRTGEGLLLAARLMETLDEVSAIAVRCTFTGLEDRALVSIMGGRAMFGDRISRTPSVTLTAEPTPDQIRDNLAEVLGALPAPLYDRFDFFPPSASLVGEELARMRENRSSPTLGQRVLWRQASRLLASRLLTQPSTARSATLF